MKLIGLRIAAIAMVLSAFPALAGGVDADKVQYCSWCHGVTGQGFSTAPRLAGQRVEYIQDQLLSFQQHTRTGPLMWGAVKSLSALQASDLAAYFSAIPPDPADNGDSVIASVGKNIYREGIQESNIPACAACHGPNAEGLGKIPRLGGLSAAYLKIRLDQWAQENHAATSPPMPRIASQLSSNDIDALASYLSFVK
jgi:cytochrome c553